MPTVSPLEAEHLFLESALRTFVASEAFALAVPLFVTTDLDAFVTSTHAEVASVVSSSHKIAGGRPLPEPLDSL